MTTLHVGQTVRIPSSPQIGTIAAFWGVAPDRRVMVETGGATWTVSEGDLTFTSVPAPVRQIPGENDADLIAFAGRLAMRTENLRRAEARYFHRLAKGYLALIEASR